MSTDTSTRPAALNSSRTAAPCEVPISTSYEVLMQVDDPDNVLTPGMRGNARIVVGSRTVGQWLWRLFWQTFNFRM